MKIKLKKQAIISGKKCAANSVHDVDNRVGEKLIDRDYADLYSDKEEVKADDNTSDQ